MLTVAAIMAAAGIVAALVVVRTGGDHWDPLMNSGTLALEPTLVAPRHLPTAQTPSTPEPTIMPRHVVEGPVTEGSTNATPGELGVSVGSVGGLYPGHRVKLRVTYRNPYSFPIVIDSVKVRARGAAGCRARQLMRPKAPHPRLPSHSLVASKIKVGMRKSAPDACQGVRFALRVQVTAVRL